MIKAHMLRVFTDSNGHFGDLASVIVDEGRLIADQDRLILTRKLNTGETVFINSIETADISVMHPQGEISFAGVGVLGVSWLLSDLRGKTIESIKGRDGIIQTWQDGENTWVQSSIKTIPPWNDKELASVVELEKIDVETTADMEHTLIWVWIDESRDLIRARTFANDWEIPEAEGNGSGAMLLASKLGRRVKVIHGKGSEIYSYPIDNNEVALGGRVVKDRDRSIA